MSQIKASFELNGSMIGQSDPVAIKIHEYILDMDNPSVTSGSGTISAGSKVLIENAAGAGLDYYVYIRNTGTSGGLTGTGKLKITDEHASSVRQISLLEVGDFLFIPIIGDNTDGGLQIMYDTAATNYVYAFFKRI
tara:strand:- start:1915 stop:2322 length:408 start_codon:yes stop_codon:yes gene_type:complete